MLDTRKDCDDLGLVSYTSLDGVSIDGLLQFTPVIDKWIGGFNYLHNVGSTFYFKINYKAPKSRIIQINLDAVNLEDPDAMIQDVLPEHPTNVLSDADCCNGKIIAMYLEDASDRLKVFDFASPANHLADIKLPDIGSVVSYHGKHDSSEFFYKFSSFCDPGSQYRVELEGTFDNVCIG